jgi:hypothetical protein
MGKSTISMAMFNSYASLPEGTIWNSNVAIIEDPSFFMKPFIDGEVSITMLDVGLRVAGMLHHGH